MAEGIHILVADDDAIVRDLLKETLLTERYRVATAVNGLEALQMFRKDCHQLLITDLVMPLLDGLSLIMEAKRIKPTLGVIMVTASSDEIILLSAFRKGADAVISKPFDHSELLKAVHYILKKN